MQQPSVTLDQAVFLGEVQEVKKTLERLTERLTKAEVELGVLRAGCETMFHTLELNGLLTGGEPTKPAEPAAKPESWDPSKIKWEKAEGTKGEYERSEDINNLEFKAMLKDLAAHKGRLYRNGLFYWTFPTGATVGRKQVRKIDL